jgi:hypothetical protein
MASGAASMVNAMPWPTSPASFTITTSEEEQIMQKTGKLVTKDEFYSVIFSQKLDVHPSPQKYYTEWKRPNQTVWAITKPGYLLEGPQEYRIL